MYVELSRFNDDNNNEECNDEVLLSESFADSAGLRGRARIVWLL